MLHVLLFQFILAFETSLSQIYSASKVRCTQTLCDDLFARQVQFFLITCQFLFARQTQLDTLQFLSTHTHTCQMTTLRAMWGTLRSIPNH